MAAEGVRFERESNSGFGPFAVLATYVAEVHAAPYRASAVMFLGIAFGAMNLLIPVAFIQISPPLNPVIFPPEVRRKSPNIIALGEGLAGVPQLNKLIGRA
ncbi:unnamed protein product, partial [Timema podura]|nr:unnamed protein product [Timema podura]